MFFIGGGTLLHHAVHYSQSIGLDIRGVCCPAGETAGRALRQFGLRVIESNDPNTELPKVFASMRAQTVFSINNEHLLGDRLLASGAEFFNIHNGLVQRYRGRSEVCVFAALCRDEEEYGVTLHRMLPGQRVDTGPVVDQMIFDVMARDGFAAVMDQSLRLCRLVFERNVRRVAEGCFRSMDIEAAPVAFKYGDLAELYANASPANKRRAAQLDEYRPYFPRLARLVASRNRPLAKSRGKRVS